MDTKKVKLRGPNGETLTISVPSSTTPDQIQAWTRSHIGRETIRKSRRDSEANKFARLQPPTEKSAEKGPTIGRGQAYAGQARHAADKLGANTKSFVDKYVPGAAAVSDLVNAAAGTNRQEQSDRMNESLSQGQAFVDKTREEGYSNVGGAAANTAYHLLGAFAPALRATKLPYLTGALGQGGVQSVLGGVGAEDGQRMGEGVSSGVGSVAGDLLVGALARAAKPVWNMTKDAKLLADKDIFATPFAASGGAMKSLEDKTMSIPGIGDMLAAGRRDGVRDYNKYMISDTSGGPLKGAGYGRQAYDEALTRFSTRYDDSLKDLNLNVNDPAIQSSINSVVRKNELDKTGIETIDKTFNNYRANHGLTDMPITGVNTPGVSNQFPFGQTTLVDGPEIQRLTQKLTERSKKFQRSNDPYQNQTGDAYADVKDVLMDAVARQKIGSGDIDALKSVNKDYARFSPVLAAGNRATASRNDGVFSPGEGLASLKQAMERKGMGNTFVRGQGDNQDVHQAAVNVLGSAYPDSGTAGRLAVTSLALGGGGLGAASLMDEPGALAPVGLMAAYVAATASKGGRKYMLGKSFPTIQNAISDVLKNSKLRKGVSAVSASDTGENPSLLNPDIYTPWGK